SFWPGACRCTCLSTTTSPRTLRTRCGSCGPGWGKGREETPPARLHRWRVGRYTSGDAPVAHAPADLPGVVAAGSVPPGAAHELVAPGAEGARDTAGTTDVVPGVTAPVTLGPVGARPGSEGCDRPSLVRRRPVRGPGPDRVAPRSRLGRP